MKPLEQFICDTCGQIINSIDDGYVEWLSYHDETLNERIAKDFRIIHHKTKCFKLDHKYGQSTLPLKEFTGTTGLIHLLKLLDIGPFHEPIYSRPDIKDFREYTEFFRRLTLPYYEEARQWWSEATSDGYLENYNEIPIYFPDNLKRMIEHYDR
jgi:hypothetical protein